MQEIYPTHAGHMPGKCPTLYPFFLVAATSAYDRQPGRRTRNKRERVEANMRVNPERNFEHIIPVVNATTDNSEISGKEHRTYIYAELPHAEL